MTRTLRLSELITIACDALRWCDERSKDDETGHYNRQYNNWDELLSDIESNLLPRGSGIDCGTDIDRELSGLKAIVLNLSFHHMDEHGCYDGWTEHTVRVVPTFIGPEVSSISGHDRNDIKEYLTGTVLDVLDTEVEWDTSGVKAVRTCSKRQA